MLNEYVKKKRKRKDAYPKKGMPHACKGMSKKSVLIAHVRNNKGRKSHAKEFILESPEIVQILAHLDQTV